MRHKTNNPNSFREKRQGKNQKRKSQLKTIFDFLTENTATATMVADATRVPHKNITRYKKDLEVRGLLWEVERKPCKKTGYLAWYLTTNPMKKLNSKLL